MLKRSLFLAERAWFLGKSIVSLKLIIRIRKGIVSLKNAMSVGKSIMSVERALLFGRDIVSCRRPWHCFFGKGQKGHCFLQNIVLHPAEQRIVSCRKA